ncbi:MAG: FAD-dependent oxidoreductase [Clostridiales bacterium]|nr:FAD-dependent oxidoreductase [Candidatus Crickella merdequi]
MSRQQILRDSSMEISMKDLHQIGIRGSNVAAAGNCPVSQCAAYARQCLAQSCGKCVPCRIGLARAAEMLERIEVGDGQESDIKELKDLLESIKISADCAIGSASAEAIFNSIEAIMDDIESHVKKGKCIASFKPIPCVAGCPAHVDIPGYIALAKEGRYEDAVRVIRYDNPFPAACALVCEHPCEHVCRRNIVDASVNIRGIKRAVVEGAGEVAPPECMPSTGKKIAVVGGGPSGLTTAYFLQLMGHQVDVFDKRSQLGGMMRYGIPRYRLPNEYLDADINAILKTGVVAKTDYAIDSEKFAKMKEEYDAIYLSIGAHAANTLGIEGENAENVLSAVALLRAMGDGNRPDFKGKKVAIIGGGNVAMDCTRTAMRLGAEKVTCVYRRRISDMTALPEEVEGAIAETCEVMPMMAPVRIETDEEGKVKALVVQPQIPGAYDRGRPKPVKADKPEVTLECDYVIAAIGQAIDSGDFAQAGVPTNRGKILAGFNTLIGDSGMIFSGGDCVDGPATIIRAIEAGKTAAANIDEALGFHHEIARDVEIPAPGVGILGKTGRIDLPEREAAERKSDFTLIEQNMTCQELKQECGRCLRCDHHGMGAVKGGRTSW